jgi:uncharacterized protein YndB with AHSA1/START domain
LNIDVGRVIGAVEREVGNGRLAGADARTVRLRRSYDAPIEEVWEALTTPERIGRWFLPISGDYRLGGRYQFEGNAGGEILACERPNRLRATWEYGDPTGPASEIEIRLTATGQGTTMLELEHTAVVPEEMWTQFGPGAVGVGWEGGLLGLALHLENRSAGVSRDESLAWQMSAEGRAFNTQSSEAWGEANRAAGADPAAAAAAVANTTAFYAPAPDA